MNAEVERESVLGRGVELLARGGLRVAGVTLALIAPGVGLLLVSALLASVGDVIFTMLFALLAMLWTHVAGYAAPLGALAAHARSEPDFAEALRTAWRAMGTLTASAFLMFFSSVPILGFSVLLIGPAFDGRTHLAARVFFVLGGTAAALLATAIHGAIVAWDASLVLATRPEPRAGTPKLEARFVLVGSAPVVTIGAFLGGAFLRTRGVHVGLAVPESVLLLLTAVATVAAHIAAGALAVAVASSGLSAARANEESA